MPRLFSGKIGCSSISRGGMSRLMNCWKLSGSNTASFRRALLGEVDRCITGALPDLVGLSVERPNTLIGRYPVARARIRLNIVEPLSRDHWTSYTSVAAEQASCRPTVGS